MVGKVFESSFQNNKHIAILSFVEGVMVILVKRCQSVKIGKTSLLDEAISRLDLQFFWKNLMEHILWWDYALKQLLYA